MPDTDGLGLDDALDDGVPVRVGESELVDVPVRDRVEDSERVGVGV